ncbi:MAG: imidazole glycerol phosphate synthase subunit HisH [Porphyromonadaceae bacterium]|nr:MAG: imidazole glycerol phosphate synthase subunit HisH [Porphyromonadaceae bacterium]
MVGIIDYGMGNLMSVQHALNFLGAEVKVCENPGSLSDIDRIVLPGVGAFGDCIKNLRQMGFVEPLGDMVMRDGVPILGICLGMQVMARRSFEGGEHEGLGWIDGDVIRIRPEDTSLRVPHIGWNEVHYDSESPLFARLPDICDFYFVHSYFVHCNDPGDVEATCYYGGTITAAIRKKNVFATQFHPEKSQDYGLRILENFLKWEP